jgi:mono/diheme cytochrome c family protein
LVDDKLGVARGVIIRRQSDGQSQDTLITAEKIEFGEKPLGADMFVFHAPADAKKAVAVSAADRVPSFAEVQRIFNGSCVGCHSGAGARGGLNLSSYQSIMAGSRSGKIIQPGDAKSSSLFLYLRGQRRQMPPSGPLPAAMIETLEKWVNAGAKND